MRTTFNKYLNLYVLNNDIMESQQDNRDHSDEENSNNDGYEE